MEGADLESRKPELDCDVILKGGITSGIVYPAAICELARTYRFRNVGGASAGAIAAAATAAAELGRKNGAFERLEKVPAELAGDGRLLSMFSPRAETKRLHGALISSMGARGFIARLMAFVRAFPWFALAGATPGLLALIAALVWGSGFDAVLLGVLAILFVIVGGLIATAYGVSRDVRRLPQVGYGLTSGYSADGGPDGPMTNWLHALLNELADLGPSTPLTFGHLWGEGSELEPSDDRIELQMMATNLVNRTAVRLPSTSRSWFFDPTEYRDLFPEEVVAWMEDHPPPLSKSEGSTARSQMLRQLMLPLRPFPEARNLPVVVATRMSLAFPLLISAVPIHKVDWSLRRNWEPRGEWREWLKSQPDDWDPSATDPAEWPKPFPSEKPTAEVCWMSDGGISSNLPIHFFDAPLPRWPTFAMNLTEFHEDYPKQDREELNSWMPQTYRQGVLENFYPFTVEGGFKALREFGESIVRTMQNRNFEALMRMPGYRDRVVHVALDKNEGGMNLGMTSEQILPLAERGGEAAKKLVAAFTRDASETDVSWDAHRWTRLRSMLVALEQLHQTISNGMGAKVQPKDARDYTKLLLRGAKDPPGSYRIKGADLVDLAEAELQAVEASAKRIRESTRSLAEQAPEPAGTLRIVPPED